MAKVSIKPEDHLIDAAIKVLEDGGTKKAACEAMGINYNTNRLDKLIEERKGDIDRTARIKKKIRGKAPTKEEIASWASEYFEGDSISEIAKRAYRSSAVVTRELNNAGILLKEGSPNPLVPAELPEVCFKESYAVGDIVWVPGYQCVGEVRAEVPVKGDIKAYRVYLLDGGRTGMNVHYHCYDLGSLQHIIDLGVDVKSLGTFLRKEDRDAMLSEALSKARMKKRGKDD